MSKYANWLGLIAAVFLLSLVLVVPNVQPRYVLGAARPWCADPEEWAFLTTINEYRQKNGVAPLRLSAEFSAASDHHSQSMSDNRYFDHFLVPEGKTWWESASSDFGAASSWRGENIAWGNATAQDTFRQWKSSPPHNENMLNPNYRVIGIGRVSGPAPTASGPSSSWVWTTSFGDTLKTEATACDGGVPVPTVAPQPVPPTAVPDNPLPPAPTPTPTGPNPSSGQTWCTRMTVNGIGTRQCAPVKPDGSYDFTTEIGGRTMTVTIYPDRRLVKADISESKPPRAAPPDVVGDVG